MPRNPAVNHHYGVVGLLAWPYPGGPPVEYRSVATGDGMGRRDLIQWHDNRALVWTWPLTLAVSGVGLAALAVGGVLWATGATDSNVFTGLAITAGVALFVALSGRLLSANRLRYQDAQFPAVPPTSAVPIGRVARRRRSTGRRSGLPYVLMVSSGGGLAFAALANWNVQGRAISVVELILAACCVSACYLAGPAARFVVTPQFLHIDTALRRFTVPRQQVAGFARGPLTLTLRGHGGDLLAIRVDTPLWAMNVTSNEYRTNIRAQLRAANRIATMMREVPAAEVPAAAVGERVIITPRWGMRVLAIATAVVAVAAIVAFPFAVRGGS